MVRYETLILTVPHITAEESSAIQASIEKAVQDAQGNVLSFERWGKYRLSYPLNGVDYGVYFLVRFEVADDAKEGVLETIKTLCAVKYNELIMRFMMTRLAKQGSLAYQRPESLEEAPAREGREGKDGYRNKYAVEANEAVASEVEMA